ncbi:MAG TPA: DUF6384 family protein, partial [Bacillota bacterium]|nr:DUF6384 family protein [Bacillota bacterium]
MNANEDKPLNLATVSAMMNLCETIEQEKKGVANAILEPEQKREAYRNRLREFYAREGVTISPESIEQAVDAQLENEAAFQPPPKNPGWWAARLFVYRLPLSFGLVTVMMVTALALAISQAVRVKGQQDAYRGVASLVAQNQRGLQGAAEAVRKVRANANANQQRRAAQWADGTLSTIIQVPQTDLQNRIDAQLAEADGLVQKAGAFVTQEQGAAGKGPAAWKTRSADQWRALAAQVRQEADQCRWSDLNQLVHSVEAALSEQNKLETAARNWALLVGNSRFLEPSSRWHQDIQQKLDTAKGYLQAGQWAEATAALGAAQQFLGDWHGWQQAQ